MYICIHLLNQNLDHFKIAVESGEVKCGKALIRHLVGPMPQLLFVDQSIFPVRNIVLATMIEYCFEASGVVLERRVGQSCIVPGFVE